MAGINSSKTTSVSEKSPSERDGPSCRARSLLLVVRLPPSQEQPQPCNLRPEHFQSGVLHLDGHPGWRTDLFLGITQRHSEVMSGSGTLVEQLP